MNSKVSQIIRHANRGKDSKLNVIIYPFNIDTEIEIAKTGHNFYRLNFDTEEVAESSVPENLTILPKHQIPMFFEYDILIFYNENIQESLFRKILETTHVPFIMIDKNSPEDYNNKEIIVTNLIDPKEENFVEKWSNVFEKFYKENKI